MMKTATRERVARFARLCADRPGRVLLGVGLATMVAAWLASHLTMKLSVVDMLPENSAVAAAYLEVGERFGEPNTVVVLEGRRDRMVEMAEALVPRLEAMPLLYNVQARSPRDFALDHLLMLTDEDDLQRTLDRLDDPSLVGTLRALNDDFEAEYTESEENLRQDEVAVAQGLQGIHRSLEIVAARLAGEDYASIEEAADALLVGDEWVLSLDREMLLILCTPTFAITEYDTLLVMTGQLRDLLAEVRPDFPEVQANLTGMGPLQKDEMDSLTASTRILTIVALVGIYLLLAYNFGGWIVPFLALVPLGVGITWTMAALYLVYGALNLFSAMIMLILLGLGIDFAIHLITRFYEERARDRSLADALTATITGSGVGVLTGGLTTAAAFFALTIASTRGIHELGFATGAGIVLTLAAMFATLPPLLVVRDRVLARRGRVATVPGSREGWPFIGRVAAASWRRPGLFLSAFVLVSAVALWAGVENEYEWDWLNLEPAGLENVRLQREIPERFGTTELGAFVITETVEEARRLKDRLEDQPIVSGVSSVSDLLPPPDRAARYAQPVADFRARVMRTSAPAWRTGDEAALAEELDRLWTNLDLMSNLAYLAGLDRVVQSIDAVTGYDTETDATDDEAVLPTLVRTLAAGVDPEIAAEVASAWHARTRSNVLRMANADPIVESDLPESVRRSMLPRDGGPGYLMGITAREYLWDQRTLQEFSNQMEEIDPHIVGTAKLTIEIMYETMIDGRNGILLALGVIVVLLFVHFRGPLGLLALVPLAGGALLMVGLMYLTGMKYNYMNFVGIPIILGIGIDDGVHALHRFREQAGTGPERLFDAFRFVGRAILLTSLTTMIGFGSLGFYEFPSMSTFGIALAYGVGACFITTVVFLPAVMRVVLGTAARVRARNGGRVVAGALLLGALAAPAALAQATPRTGAEWLAAIQNAERVDHSYGVMRQTITTSGGSERTFTIRAWSAQGGDVSLMEYVDPARVAGDKILQLDGGDNFWYYMQRRDVTRHFAGHTRRQSAMGSDFSYEDMASGDFQEDYTADVLGPEALDGVPCVQLRLIPTETGPSYDSLLLWVGRDDDMSRRIEYYDDGHHLKTLSVGDFREIEGRRVAMRMQMVNEREGSRTLIETVEMTFRNEPDPSLFTQAALSRRIP